MKIVERRECQIELVVPDLDAKPRRETREVRVEIIAIDAARRFVRRGRRAAAAAEVAHDEYSKLTRLDRQWFGRLVRRDVERYFRALITHRCEPRGRDDVP
jgi:hypothetical protein